MARGQTNARIARELFVSESAVSKHIASIFAKLGLLDTASVDRRVSAVLAYISSTNRAHLPLRTTGDRHPTQTES